MSTFIGVTGHELDAVALPQVGDLVEVARHRDPESSVRSVVSGVGHVGFTVPVPFTTEVIRVRPGGQYKWTVVRSGGQA